MRNILSGTRKKNFIFGKRESFGYLGWGPASVSSSVFTRLGAGWATSENERELPRHDKENKKFLGVIDDEYNPCLHIIGGNSQQQLHKRLIC